MKQEARLQLIVGLGNPGLLYRPTRHNVGFRVLDHYAQQKRAGFRRSPHKGHMARFSMGGAELHLLKPSTFMNLSGEAVRSALHGLGLGPEALLVICDDLDLPVGKLRLRRSGGTGGHNGLRSIVEQIGSDGFARLRVGIGRPPDDDVIRFVLGTPSGSDARQLAWAQDQAAHCIDAVVNDGVAAAMGRFNGVQPPA